MSLYNTHSKRNQHWPFWQIQHQNCMLIPLAFFTQVSFLHQCLVHKVLVTTIMRRTLFQLLLLHRSSQATRFPCIHVQQALQSPCWADVKVLLRLSLALGFCSWQWGHCRRWYHMMIWSVHSCLTMGHTVHIFQGLAVLKLLVTFWVQWSKAFTAACHALCNVCLHVRSPNTARRFWAVVCPAAFFQTFWTIALAFHHGSSWDILLPRIVSRQWWDASKKKQSNNCVCHSCKCRPEPASFDFSGSPCQPWSAFGKKGGWDDARWLLVFVWTAVVRSSLPAVAIHECTPEFLTWLLDEFLGPFYLIVHIKASPADLGGVLFGGQEFFQFAFAGVVFSC